MRCFLSSFARVLRQLRSLPELLPARVTSDRCSRAVPPHVNFQLMCRGKRLDTDVTDVLFVMDAHVLLPR